MKSDFNFTRHKTVKKFENRIQDRNTLFIKIEMSTCKTHRHFLEAISWTPQKSFQKLDQKTSFTHTECATAS